MALTDKLKAIANAIRGKTGSTDLITLDEMPTEIENIQTGSSVQAPYIAITTAYNPYVGDVVAAVDYYGSNVYSSLFQGNCEIRSFTMHYVPETNPEISHQNSVCYEAFKNCGALMYVNLPAGITQIENYAFANCSQMHSITLPSSITFIDSNVFENTPMTTINVPWSEGEVANAPWGATNATINYNYVEST